MKATGFMKRLTILPVLAILAGCTSGPEKLGMVGGNPFDQPPPQSPASRVNYPPGDPALAQRLSGVGQQLLQANKDLGIRPGFATIGSAEPEIFHQGQHMVWVTEGLIRRCPTDNLLAGVLSVELGKMIAERERLKTPDLRQPQYKPPIQVPIGNAGGFRDADLVGRVELAKFEKVHPKTPPAVRLDPVKLGQAYFERAGYAAEDFEHIRPLLDEADRHCVMEKQFKGQPQINSWTP